MARRRRPSGLGPGRGSVHPLLDLHGLTGDEARGRAERWLRDHAAASHRTVVIVTGRGNRSHGPPVLRGEIEHLLDGLTGTLVEAWEHTEGGGAFRIRLTRAAGWRAPAPSADDGRLLRDYPPELRRRAEEALWELGIAPTPALIRAEIRRILADEE